MWYFLSQSGSVIGSLMFIFHLFQTYFPHQLSSFILTRLQRLYHIFYPYVQIKFFEHSNDGFTRNKAYVAIQTYLGSTSRDRAKSLKAEMIKGTRDIRFSIDNREEIADVYRGISVSWVSDSIVLSRQASEFSPGNVERRYYQLTFMKGQRDFVLKTYLDHVIKEGKAIARRNKLRKLYTNVPQENNDSGDKQHLWRSVVFEHPATFNTIAMDPLKKKDIINDLVEFKNTRNYYKKVGKSWKRGYLLYGPPGTGKSTMIAAMANFLQYDVYDLELTVVKNNTELRQLLMETSKKSIIVIEDIDCSLDLTGKREMGIDKKKGKKNDREKSKVTLSGLLNFIDGLWSACGEEKVFVFTTNHPEKLDRALIRTGRMDMHIEMSYCCFESFKTLAMNYLGIGSHPLFPEIRSLLNECEIAPADVAEHLIPKTKDGDCVLTCLEKLIDACKDKKSQNRTNVMSSRHRDREIVCVD